MYTQVDAMASVIFVSSLKDITIYPEVEPLAKPRVGKAVLCGAVCATGFTAPRW
jgi:hypothetical protein